MSGRIVPFLSVMIMILSAAAAFAAPPQSPAGASPAPGAQPLPPKVAAGPDGVAIESGNGEFRLQIGFLAHADGRFVLDDEHDQFANSFTIRRGRPYLRGRLGRTFEFSFNPDLAGGTLVVQDAYIDAILSPAFRVRTGKAKTPFGFERLHSASNLLFLERALPTAIVPNRDIGVQVLGDLRGGVVSYLAGVTNGVADGGSADSETNDSKDLSGRLIIRPFTGRQTPHPARGLTFGIAASRGRATGTTGLPTFRTSTLQQTFFSYAGGASAAVADGARTRYSPSVSYFRGSFGGWAEYVRSEGLVRRGDVSRTIAHEAWQVAGSWVLTGETATDAGAGVRPRHNVDVGNRRWGALQLAARYHLLEVDPDAIAYGLAATGASRKAEAWTVGLRWYVTGNVSYALNVERTVFDGDADGARPAEHALAFRTQLAF